MKRIDVLWFFCLVLIFPLTSKGVDPGQKIWEFDTGGGDSSPAIGTNGKLYVGGNDGKVYAIDTATGQMLWNFQTGAPVESSPTIGPDGTVYIGSMDANVYALNGATGQEIWRVPVVPWVSGSPAVGANGIVYVGSGRAADNNNIYALNARTGERVWEFQAGFGQSARSSPALGADETVYVGAVAKLYAFEGASGAKKWEFPTGGFVDSSPAIGADGTIYAGANDGKLYALDGATGQKLWEFSPGFLPVGSSPAIGLDGTVYVGSIAGGVFALNGKTGQSVWMFATGGAVFSSPALTADGTLYIGSNDGKLYALTAGSGEKLWEFDTGGPVFSSPALGPDGTVYLGASKLYALRGTAGLAASPWPKYRHDLQNTGQGTRAPRIEKQPTLAILKEGEEGRIAVEVSGLPVPVAQWLFNGAPITSATNIVLTLPMVTRLMEGSYWLAASNALGRATSAPITAVVSNVAPQRFVSLRWMGRESVGGMTLQSADRLVPGGAWQVLSNYPPSAVEQSYVELSPGTVQFYRLNAFATLPLFTGNGKINGWELPGPIGSHQRIEFSDAINRWTNWLILTNLVLPSAPYLYLDHESFGQSQRVYRMTPGLSQ